jgi:hypothetical protein
MNDTFSSLNVVLAHGIDRSASGGISILIIMSLFLFGLLIFRKAGRIPKGLFVSSIIPYIIVTISILDICFECIPKAAGYFCFAVVFYSSFPFLDTGSSYFLATFVVDTLIIFGIIRLILFIKRKFSSKKSMPVQ